ncbi:S41 family peptidase [Pontibacter sp. G13]|uniref:S41 family peptidase n=1 Tax=Pontibacter sp. G13 TaxID=3074898 RepID=UPI00288A835B|nr:S41 family peptidase [Pontibacter sp. G13]WNJ20025.1 S41 family peptidase [Pontibacter sp. G13]
MKLFHSSLLVLVMLVAGAPRTFAQTVPDSIYEERLYLLCKVWGHAKYFHSKIAQGTVLWNQALLDALPAMETAPTNAAFNDSLLIMLGKAGPSIIPPVYNTETFPDSLSNLTDWSWIYHPSLSDSVSSELDSIRTRFYRRPNVWVQWTFTNGNPNFEYDNAYSTGLSYPPRSLRLLALFRYWNIIQYFFPYHYQMDENWDSVLREFIPEMVQAQNVLEYHLAFKRLTTHINDAHGVLGSSIYRSFRGNHYPPFRARWIDNQMVVYKSWDAPNSLKSGDVILEIDGISVSAIQDSLADLTCGSNEASYGRDMIHNILFGPEGPMQVKYEDSTGVFTKSVSRTTDNLDSAYHEVGDKWYSTTTPEGCEMGVVNMGLLESDDVAQMYQELKDKDAIIFDVRNYPNGTMWTLLDILFDGPTEVAKFTVPDLEYPGTFFWQQATVGSASLDPFQGKIMLLFDERTQSHGEYTCMALGARANSLKIGSMTAGADGNVSRIYLPGNMVALFSGIGVFHPDYRETQRVGLIPDYEVKPTIQGMRAGRDEVLEFALSCDLIQGTSSDDPITPRFEVYPNPTNKGIHVRRTMEADLGLDYEILTLTGKKVLSGSLNPGETHIEMDGLAAGAYVLVIETETGLTPILVNRLVD